MMVAQGPSARKKGVPFAPFLAAGGIIGILVGPELIGFYAGTFLS
jgi:prepilin signal peptidase PulO-like enzyme (type II secretory pathway)